MFNQTTNAVKNTGRLHWKWIACFILFEFKNMHILKFSQATRADKLGFSTFLEEKNN